MFEQLGSSPQAIAQAQIQQRLTARFEALMREQPFPLEHIPEDWHGWKSQAMEHTSPMALGISGEEFRIIYHMDEVSSINMDWFGRINNLIAGTTPQQLQTGGGMDEYCSIQDDCTRVARIFNNIVQEIRLTVEQEFTIEARKSPIPNFGGMSAVNGEA